MFMTLAVLASSLTLMQVSSLSEPNIPIAGAVSSYTDASYDLYHLNVTVYETLDVQPKISFCFPLLTYEDNAYYDVPLYEVYFTSDLSTQEYTVASRIPGGIMGRPYAYFPFVYQTRVDLRDFDGNFITSFYFTDSMMRQRVRGQPREYLPITQYQSMTSATFYSAYYIDIYLTIAQIPEVNYNQFESYLGLSAGDNSYDVGFQEGYEQGKSEGQQIGFQEGVDSVDIDSIAQSNYDNGYRKGKNDGIELANDYTFGSLFASIADTPILILRNMLSFEVFDIMAYKILFSMIAGVLALYVIRKFI